MKMMMVMIMIMDLRVMTVKENGLMQKIRLSHFVTQTAEITAVRAGLRERRLLYLSLLFSAQRDQTRRNLVAENNRVNERNEQSF